MSPPIVLVKGDDPTLLASVVAEAVAAALGGEDRSIALEELGDDDLAPSSIVDAARTPPFLSARRVLLVRDVGRWSTEQVEPLVAYAASPEETTRIVLVAGGGQTSQRLVNAVKKAGEVIDAGVPSGRGRKTWLVDHLKASPLRFDAAAGDLVLQHLGEDLGRVGALIDILVSAYGDGARIGIDELIPLLGEAGGVAPWDLTDAIDRGDTAEALALLKRMHRHPMVVLATLHRHFGAMMRLDGSGIGSEQEAATVLGMAPYPAKKAMTQAARLGTAAITRAITLIAAADLDLRGLKEWPDDLVLEVLVARLSRLRAAAR